MFIKKLSNFIINLNYDDISKIAIEKAKLCFLDYLGLVNRGIHEESVQIILKSLEEMNSNGSISSGKCSIIGDGYFNVYNTGFINSISAHALDLDDGHRFAQIHPGSLVFSTALAISEINDINGKNFLEAVICGYEIAIVLGTLVNPYHRNQGFHTTGTIGTFATGTVVAKLLNLSLKQINNALGLCGTQSAGLLESNHQGTMGKQLHVGKAVYNGILSGYLAKNGFTGAESIVDGEEGLLKAMSTQYFKNIDSNKLNNYLNSHLERFLGKFHIKDVYLKKYPFCRHLHSSIDATLNIFNKYDITNKENLERITIKTYKIAAEHNNFNPKSKEDLKQSLPYAVAIACINREMSDLESIINFDINNFENKKFTDILNMIKIEESDDLTELTPNYRPSRIIIETKNKVYEDFVKLPIGEAENPLSKEDILEKFKSLNPNFDLNKLNIINNINNLEYLNISEFMKLFNQ